jgi:hypothetical protein
MSSTIPRHEYVIDTVALVLRLESRQMGNQLTNDTKIIASRHVQTLW